MPQSLAQVYIHIVFSTKKREHFIQENTREGLQSYLVGALSKLRSYTYEIYANSDHIHILCRLPRTTSIADLIGKIKAASSKWMKSKGVKNFDWQDGYGAFSVSASGIENVRKYIINQPKHHRKVEIKDEMRDFFKEYDIAFDERYVWD